MSEHRREVDKTDLAVYEVVCTVAISCVPRIWRTISSPLESGALQQARASGEMGSGVGARHYQITALTTLLVFNLGWIDFGANTMKSALAICVQARHCLPVLLLLLSLGVAVAAPAVTISVSPRVTELPPSDATATSSVAIPLNAPPPSGEYLLSDVGEVLTTGTGDRLLLK